MRTLGICLSHDAGVALLEDGEIRFAASEERFGRKKSLAGVPEASLRWLARELGGDLGGIDAVAVAGSVQGAEPPIRSDNSDWFGTPWRRALLRGATATRIDRFFFGTRPGVRTYRAVFRHVPGASYRQLLRLLPSLGCAAPVERYDHHSCHLLSAAATAGWDECLAVSSDCFGDGLSGRVGLFAGGELRGLAETPMYHSIGEYYLFVTNLCGFPMAYHCGKTTGLAAYGKPTGALDYFRERIAFDPASGSIVCHGKFMFERLAEMRRELGTYSREDLAAAIQTVTEEVVTASISHWLERTGQKRVVLAGGLFANVKLNQRIAALPGVEGVFVHPHMGDGGLAAGAAFARAGVQPYRMPHAFLGPDTTSGPVDVLLASAGLEVERPVDLEAEIAALLAQGNVVARVSGRMEYGPRALGNRSILYQATDPTVNTWLNEKLRRSEFMPFAPMMLEEDAPLLLEGYSVQTAHAAEFMTITYDVTEKCKRESPAVVHVDGTARPQVVSAAVNPSCAAILREYKRLTGLSALVNTSYNVHDEPIVHTPEDAIRAFVDSGLDVLVLGDYVARQPVQAQAHAV